MYCCPAYSIMPYAPTCMTTAYSTVPAREGSPFTAAFTDWAPDDATKLFSAVCPDVSLAADRTTIARKFRLTSPSIVCPYRIAGRSGITTTAGGTTCPGAFGKARTPVVAIRFARACAMALISATAHTLLILWPQRH